MKQTEETTKPSIMEQYNELKAKRPEAILLFRVGDFYEAYDEDATKIGEILGITVTRKFNSKDKGSDGHALKMAGFPHHALDTYLPKLVRAGVRVAICDHKEGSNKVTKEYPSDENEAKPETDEIKVQEENKPSEDIETLKAQIKDLCEEVTDLQLGIKLREGQIYEASYSIIKETIKMLEDNLPSDLEEYYRNLLGRIEIIRIKNNLDFRLTKDETNYLIREVLKSQNK